MSADGTTSTAQLEDFFGPKEQEFEPGTNVALGTQFQKTGLGFGKVLPWYDPTKATAPANWKEKWATLRTCFDRIVDECRPVGCVLVQHRIPAYAPCPPKEPKFLPGFKVLLPGVLLEQKLLWSGGGLEREPATLSGLDWRPLTGLFPIKSVAGKPMLDGEGKPRAFRFGLRREIFVHVDPDCSGDPRPLPTPSLDFRVRA